MIAAFKPDGSTTAGNASQVSDGAAASLLMKRSTAQKLGLPIIGIFRSFAVAGVPPRVMGIGPAVAIPAALAKAGLTVKDIDLWEINEAFASQAAYCVKVLGVPLDRLNVNGGAIALGHPLGATGARQTATLLHEMARRRSRYGVVSMCIGSGMGAAAVYERV
jgi:acetyl-CoA acyltransferase 1